MKVFVTGGAGYVGAALVNYLLDKKIATEVTVYDNFSSHTTSFLANNNLQNIKFIKADILDSRTLNKSMTGHDAVVHLAELKSLDNPHFLEQVNHWGTAEVCYAAESLNIKNIIFLSSTKVYPFTFEEMVIQDDFEAAPSNAYGSSKLRGEGHVERFMGKKGMNVHILRASSIYGDSPALKYDSFLNKLIINTHYFNRVELLGTGFQQRSFVHIDNVISTIGGLLTGSVESQIHNLSDKVLSIIDLIDVLKEEYHNMEFIFTSHHLSLPHIRVKSSSKVLEFIKNNDELGSTIKKMALRFSR